MANDKPYTGPFPRKRHSHRCLTCSPLNAVACYKSRCTKPQQLENCSWCRASNSVAVIMCPLCQKDSFMCQCQVDGLSAKANAEANHLKRVEEFRQASEPARVETWSK